MYTIISATNRPGSNTLKVAKEYQRILQAKGVAATLLSLEDVSLVKDAAFDKLQAELLIPTTKFLIIVPEYNGSYPGVLKLIIDNSKIEKVWWHKKVLLAGVSTGRAGNLRGMEHLAGVCHYLKMTVYHNMLPISGVDKLMNENGQFKDESTVKVISSQLELFMHWAG